MKRIFGVILISPVMDADKYKYSEADDLYDQDIPIDRKCPVCKGKMYVSPDCVESCVDSSCSFDGIAEYRKNHIT